MKRHQQILAALLLVQLALIAVVFWPRAAATGGGEQAFPELTVDDIVSLRIVDESGQSVYLRRTGEGWVLPDAGDYPGNSSMITPLLEKLVGLTSDRLVTRTEASHQRLQVAQDNFIRQLTLELADGSFQILYLGSAPQYTTTHFRVEGQNETYLTSALNTWELNALPASWVEASYSSIPVDSLTEVILENKNGTFTFVPLPVAAEGGTTTQEWTLQGLNTGETANATKIRSTVNQAASVVVTNPLGKTESPDYGLASPNAVITLKTADQTVTLTVGAQTVSGNYVLKGSHSPHFIEVSAYSIESLVGGTRADFITAPAP
ncbi:MAG: DUF4340 domain-containing protein [Anaerolineae bacterium]|nr:DUF4340 domain-containing protein [Anaerolineae bacterium]